ncbi:MAG: UDP-3-O-acyl-N-acetylglucosamine deacetylase [Rhodospirillum sp.]|nr:UDP-3-O-acyl-N-acetylglucosamine deacetylase [Rhodospirillum sp.]MCF8488809.1 UDP-3-O-acyl-N-acetylglucosamine deacetylase [Rhodospirillum sp.]MCF8500853.1 UDP-3-O-acyl-N-acetylglucosamine deacetylase [Rhodospirillum sp.]
MDGLHYPGDTARDETLEGLSSMSSHAAHQHTIKAAISCTGIGVHKGQETTLVLRPAAPDTGIVFRRVDLPDDRNEIPVSAQAVVDGRLCTTIGNAQGTTVSTVEHLMAALASLSIDNMIAEVDGPELPIMDGSAAPFVFLLDCAGRAEQDVPRRAIRVLKSVTVSDGSVSATLRPAERGLTLDFEIDFKARAIGRQYCHLSLSSDLFRDHIARARTFGLREDVEKLHAVGLGLGGSLDNAVVVDDDKVLNEDGLRYREEFVRHKTLDAIGDLYMQGLPLIGHYQGLRSSHHHNNLLLRALLADPEAFEITEVDARDLEAPIRRGGFHATRLGEANEAQVA